MRSAFLAHERFFEELLRMRIKPGAALDEVALAKKVRTFANTNSRGVTHRQANLPVGCKPDTFQGSFADLFEYDLENPAALADADACRAENNGKKHRQEK